MTIFDLFWTILACYYLGKVYRKLLCVFFFLPSLIVSFSIYLPCLDSSKGMRLSFQKSLVKVELND